MKNQIILWLSSLVLTFLIGYFKNVTDTNFPITGTFGIEGNKVSYKLDKVSYDKTVYTNIIISDIEGVKGKLIFKKDGIEEQFFYREIDRGLEVEIPKLKAGKSIDYKVELLYKDRTYDIPAKDYITLTFWGNIPTAVNVLTFILLYGGLLIALRCFLEIFNEDKNLKKYAFITCTIFLTLNALIIPLRNSYKLGAINNYIPPVTDIIDPVLLTILFIWIFGTIIMFYKKYTRTVVSAITLATIVMIFIVD